MDRASLGVLVVYLCQMEGRPLVKEILSVIKKRLEVDKSDVKMADVKNALESAKKRGLLSINYEGTEKRYSVKNILWANPPEVAHIKTLLPKLLKTPEAQGMYEFFKGLEASDNDAQKDRELLIAEYKALEVDVELITPLLGGQQYGKEGKDTITFRRLNGKIWLPLNLWLKAALSIRFRQLNLRNALTKYIVADDVFLDEKVLMSNLEKLGVMLPNGTGVISILEMISAGTKFTLKISFPTKGGLSPEHMVWCLNGVHLGAKHKEFGKIAVRGHKDIPVW